MGYIWVFLIVISIVVGIINGRTAEVIQAVTDNAKLAVEISISLIGVMAFWLGLVKLAEKSGIVELISKIIKPITDFLFPEIPSGHPSLGNIAMNVTANALGVTNAATPIGIKAMEEMQSLNEQKDTATNPMCTFLAINTAGFQLVPASVIAVLVAAGCNNPTEIIAPTIMVTLFGTIVAIITGEGCSGGALGLAVADRVMMLEHAYYTVISPEGCASILWRDAAMYAEAAEALKITSADLLKLGVIDAEIKEPLGGAHTDYEKTSAAMKNAIKKALDELDKLTPAQLKEERYNKFRAMGQFLEG